MRWQVRWTDPAGVEKSKCFPDGRKTASQNFKTGIEADLLRDQYRDPKAGRVTLRAFVEDTWLPGLEAGTSTFEATERRLRLHILPQLGGKTLAQLSPSTIKAWLHRLDAAPSTKRVLRALLSSVLEAALEDGKIASNPARASSVKSPKLERRLVVPWTAEQVAAIRAAMPARWAAMVDAGAGLGLRIGEAMALAAGDIDWMRRRVHVRRQVKRVGGQLVFGRPKGGKERHVPLPDSVAFALSEHIRQHPPAAVTLPEDGPSGRPVTAALLFTMPRIGKAVERNSWFTTAWHPAVRAAGITPSREAGFHQLRHHYASVLLAGGVDVRTLAGALGHGDPGFTLRTYTHLMPDAADRIRAAIDHGTSNGTVTERKAGNP
jgi:integrase